MALVLVLPLALGFSGAPVLRPNRVKVVAPQMGAMDLVNSVKDSIVPTDTDQTLRNVFGYQALAWGVGGLLAPAYISSNVLGFTADATSNLLMRGTALGNLALAGRLTSGSDSDAATTGVVWFALWTWALRNAVGAGAVAGWVPTIITWNAIMTVVSARRRGGLWTSITNADTDLLNGLLPRDYETSMRNFVGMQMTLWGIAGLFFSGLMTTIFGLAGGAVGAALGTGLAITNVVIGGKVMGGSDNSAAANGVVFFGGWAVLNYLGKGAGVLTGANVGLIMLWNAACAAYCAFKLLSSD